MWACVVARGPIGATKAMLQFLPEQPQEVGGWVGVGLGWKDSSGTQGKKGMKALVGASVASTFACGWVGVEREGGRWMRAVEEWWEGERG